VPAEILTGAAMTPVFAAAYAFVRAREGGYVNALHDAGGPTKWGVTQRTYTAWRQARGLVPQSVVAMTESECRRIYFYNYWLASGSDRLPPVVALVHFDAAVNHGINKARTLLEQVRGPTPEMTAWRYIKARRKLYIGICLRRPSQLRFLRGWMNRLKHLRNQIRSWSVTELAPAAA
jgi:hypothetical protein